MKYLFLALTSLFSLNILSAQQDAYELANNSIKERGGKQLLNNIESIKMDVTIQQNGKTQNAVVYIKNNEAYRIEFIDNPKAKEYILATTKVGLKSNISNGLEKASLMNEQELSSYKQKMNIFGPLLDPQNQGVDLMYIGLEKMDGAPYQVLAFHDHTNFSPEPVKVYLNMKNEVEKIEEILDSENGRITNTIEYNNYKPAKNSNVTFPYTIKQNGTVTTIKEITVNPNLNQIKMSVNDDELDHYTKK